MPVCPAFASRAIDALILAGFRRVVGTTARSKPLKWESMRRRVVARSWWSRAASAAVAGLVPAGGVVDRGEPGGAVGEEVRAGFLRGGGGEEAGAPPPVAGRAAPGAGAGGAPAGRVGEGG